MSDRKPKVNRRSPDRKARIERGRWDGLPSAARAEELGRIIEELRDEVRALGRRLDGGRELARPGTPGGVSPVAPEETPRSLGAGHEHRAARPESADSPAPGGGEESAGLRADESTEPAPLTCRLHELSLLAPGKSRSTLVLSAHVPFEMQVALEVAGDSNHVRYPLSCLVSVRARRLGSGEGSIVLGEASQRIASARETARFRCKGAPLASGLYRVEATAAVCGPGDARASGMAFLNGGLVRVS
jgi:hypothetical protein